MPGNRFRRVRNDNALYLFAGAKVNRPVECFCRIQKPALVRLNIQACEISYRKRRKPVFLKLFADKSNDFLRGGSPVAADSDHEVGRPKLEAFYTSRGE